MLALVRVGVLGVARVGAFFGVGEVVFGDDLVLLVELELLELGQIAEGKL